MKAQESTVEGTLEPGGNSSLLKTLYIQVVGHGETRLTEQQASYFYAGWVSQCQKAPRALLEGN